MTTALPVVVTKDKYGHRHPVGTFGWARPTGETDAVTGEPMLMLYTGPKSQHHLNDNGAYVRSSEVTSATKDNSDLEVAIEHLTSQIEVIKRIRDQGELPLEPELREKLDKLVSAIENGEAADVAFCEIIAEV